MRALVAATLVLTLGLANAESPSGLPFDLKYGMSRAETQAHMKAMEQYRAASGSSNELTYVVPDPMSGSKNGLLIKFDTDKLVEIASMKSGMSPDAYSKYLAALLAKTKEWSRQGMTTVMEDSANAFYLYRDDRSYVSVSGISNVDKAPSKSVTLTFTEAQHFNKGRKK
jgi:hypothetical protein